MVLPYCVYILFSLRDRKLYIGFTTNLDARIKNHTEGKTVSTSKRRPLKLLYCEFHRSKVDASRWEHYFKTTSGKKAIKLMLRASLKKEDYAGNHNRSITKVVKLKL